MAASCEGSPACRSCSKDKRLRKVDDALLRDRCAGRLGSQRSEDFLLAGEVRVEAGPAESRT